MAQSARQDGEDFITNTTFPLVRGELNNNIEALFTQSSGQSEPATTEPYQPWVDTSGSDPVWKIRNSNNSDWITVGVLDPSNFQVGGVTPIANGGTGQTTVANAIAALLPSQTGNADKALTTNGTSLLWSVITSSSFTKYTFAAGTGNGSTRTHTWTKPSSGSTAIVLIWGGGGAGGADNDQGGGGGAGSNCGFGLFPLSELGPTEPITIGQGGQGTSSDGNGQSGTNSTFGLKADNITPLVTSYGGVGGDDDDSQYAQGSTPFGQGERQQFLELDNERDDFSFSIFSGGYGARQSTSDGGGGKAVFGGAGGGGVGSGGSTGGIGGTSIIAGNGGQAFDSSNALANGSIPGGGGGGARSGAGGDGGDGECWVIIF